VFVYSKVDCGLPFTIVFEVELAINVVSCALNGF